MRAGLPVKEKEILEKWGVTTLYKEIRAASKTKPKWVLHDGPPYANGGMHIGHALNNILKDFMIRSRQMVGYDVDYIPGWDCHGLPIEWKVEEEFRAQGRDKKDISPLEFRKACRVYAKKWVEIQKADRIRMGVVGDWDNPYLTMNFSSEAVIASEFLKVVKNELVFRGSKPIMWSPVERTSLAEAEVEYQEKTSPMIWVKFPVKHLPQSFPVKGNVTSDLSNFTQISIVIWTTTPWTIPANRAVSYSKKISYGLYQIDAIEEGLEFTPFAIVGEKIVVADKLAEDIFKNAKVAKFTRLSDVNPEDITCDHPLKNWEGANGGYQFPVPLIAGEHVTDDAGTGFVHTAPSHGVDDYLVWLKHGLPQSEIPFTVDEEGRLTKEAPGFEGALIMQIEGKAKDIGKEGDANPRVLDALKATGNLLAMGRLKHQYPHSWRSRAPLIYRNTPQWFIAMDKAVDALGGKTLREVALSEIDKTDWGNASAKGRIETMVRERPDWLISRQRAWGVPIALFVNKATQEVLMDDEVNARIIAAMEVDGADAWYDKPAQYFLGDKYKAEDFEQIHDILDVWFDSGSTHAFVLESRDTLPRPANMYLEGTDQHRGWFQSSLLESCATRGVAPYKQVRTHGMTVDDKGRKMSKSLGNGIEPQDIANQNGIEILRVLFASADYTQELALGKTMISQASETYRKLRNTIRYILASTKDFNEKDLVAYGDLPFLEQWVLARTAQVDEEVRKAYDTYDFKEALSAISDFANLDLSAFFVDVRKDALYCDPLNSKKRRAAQTVLSILFKRFLTWLAPICPFTTEEAWGVAYPDAGSVHLLVLEDVPSEWNDAAVLERMEKLREFRKAVTGALELKRADKTIGSSLEAAPIVYLDNAEIKAVLGDEDLAELCITSALTLKEGKAPEGAFVHEDVAGVGVVFEHASGVKCRRSWKYFDPKTAHPNFPDITPRDAEAVLYWESIQ